jgi:hypothetical protein
MDSVSDYGQPSRGSWEVQKLFKVPHIASINAENRWLSADVLADLLVHPSFSGVKSLELPDMCRADEKCADLLQQCASLKHLSFDCFTASTLLRALPQLPVLSSLQLGDRTLAMRSGFTRKELSFIHLCPTLRLLRLVQLRTWAARAVLAFNSHLTKLSLTDVNFTSHENDLQLWSQCLDGLPLLVSFSFEQMTDGNMQSRAIEQKLDLRIRRQLRLC